MSDLNVTSITPVCTCTVGPGKFEGETPLTALGYWHGTNGNADESHGNVDFFKSPLNFDANQDALSFCRALGYCQTCIDADLDDARDLAGVAIREDDAGFVFRREITSAESYQELTDAYANEDEDEDEGGMR